MELLEQFRRNLRARLDKGDLTVTELADRAEINRVTLHKILSGKIEPRLNLCEKLAKLAGISPPAKIFQKNRRSAV